MIALAVLSTLVWNGKEMLDEAGPFMAGARPHRPGMCCSMDII